MKTFISLHRRHEDIRPAVQPVRRTAVHHRRAFIWLGILAALLGGYAAAGFLGVPYLLRTSLQSFVRTHYKRNLQVREVHFNPFTFVLEARGVALPDANGRPMASFERLRVLPDIATLWRFAPSFREIILERPVVHAVVRANGKLNLSDLEKGLGKTHPQHPGPPMRLYIQRLAVIDGSGDLVDRTRPGPFRQVLGPVSFELRDFSTRPGTGNEYQLTAASPGGMRLKWSGTVRLQPLASQGSFEVTHLPVKTVWSYLRQPLPIAAPPGAIALHGQYDAVEAPRRLGLKVSVPTLTITGLKVRPKQADTDYVDLPRIELKDTRVDLARHDVHVGQMVSTGGTVNAWRSAGGRVNLLDLISPSASGASGGPVSATPTAAAQKTPAAHRSSTPAWHLSVPDIEVQHLKVAAEDRGVQPAVAVTLEPLDVRVAGYSSAPDARLDITVDAGVNTAGRLHLTAQVSPSTRAATAHLEARDLGLAVLQPYIAQRTGMILLKGKLTSRLDVERKPGGALTARGNVRVADLRTVDEEAKQDFIRWRDLRIGDIRYRSRPASLRIGRIVAWEPYARVTVFPNLTTNIQEILTPRAGRGRALQGARGGPQQVVARRAAPGHPEERGKGSERRQTVAAAPRTPLTPIPVSIRSIDIINGSANYADHWIQPNFAVGIQTLNGSVSGLSSDPSSRATVKLDGKVDRYAPAHISGQVNLLSATTYSDITLSFTGLEMTTVTPYSGHFAGYKIDKGKLSVDLNYKVENRELTAQQHFVIDQLQLGERVKSKDAVKLPVRLAVALLKDRNGVIDIGLPMKGNLDDPKFSLGPLIWKAFVNLLSKIVTAPFAVLGHLFGGGAQVNIIEFPAGSAAIDPAAKGKLAALVKALKDRPQLKLDVPASYSPDLDRRALAAARLRQQLTQSAHGHESELVNPEQHLRLLMTAYRQELKGAELPASVQAARQARTKDATALDPAIHDMEAALIAHEQVPDTELQQLGTQRAQTIQDALVAGGVDGSRVFIVNERKPAELAKGKGGQGEKGQQADKVPVQMSLK